MNRSSDELSGHGHEDEPCLFVDAHVDLPYYMMKHGGEASLSTLDQGPFTLKKAWESGVRLFCTAIFCEDTFNGERSFKHLQGLLRFTRDRFDRINLINNNDSLNRLKERPDEIGTLFLLENADALFENLSYIEQLKNEGIRIVGLTHAGKNRLADGNAVLYPDGLSKGGREVVRVLNENGYVIDIAHLHSKCFRQLLDLFDGPVITSHTGLREACDIPRNIDLDQAGEIFDRDGVAGITFNPEMLSPDGEADLEDIFMHVDILVQKFGPDCVGIGSDFCGFDRGAEGLEEVTKIPKLIDIMLEHGYGQEAVKKIMGLNWLRVYKNLFKGTNF